MSLVLVFGATGTQGGSVVQRLLKNPKYKVRAITRNTTSDKAKELAAQGVDVVAGDANDASSLKKAFEGVYAAFVVTAYWPSIFALGRDGAGEEEVQQFKNAAHAAAATPTLEHLVISTLPWADKISGGRLKVPHWDYKQVFAAWLRSELPDLWKKTSEFWPGMYAENFAFFDQAKLIKVPASNAYMMVMPSKASGIIPGAGAASHNTGVVVEGLLNAGSNAFTRTAMLVTDYLSMEDLVALFEKVTGKSATYVEISDAGVAKLFGVIGTELASQFRFSEEYPKWEDFLEPGVLITHEELGIEKGDIFDFEGAFTQFKTLIV